MAASYHLGSGTHRPSLPNASMDLKNYSRLWDGSEPGWTVVRHTEDRERITVVFAQEGATVAEMKALRSVDPSLQAKPAVTVLAELKGQTELSLGEFESRAARELRKRCETAGLRVVFSPCQAVNHCLINEQTKIFFLIEDHSIGEMVAEEAIRQGLPVRHSTP